MQPNLKPETVPWWTGPNEERETSTYFLHFLLSLNVWILHTSLEISCFYCRDNSKIDLLFAVLCKVVICFLNLLR